MWCGDNNNAHHHPPTQTPALLIHSLTHGGALSSCTCVYVCVCVYIFTVIFLSFTERAVNYRHFTSSSPPPRALHYHGIAHTCVAVCAHTHTLAFVDGFENKNLPAARPSSTTFASSSFCRSSSPRGCFLRYSGCGARPLTHTGAATRVRTHTVTHTRASASNQRRLLSRGETRSATQKKWLLLPEGAKKKDLPRVTSGGGHP